MPFSAGHAAEDIEQDNRSDDKGPEPEGVTVASFGAETYAFIALERVGGIMVYDVSTPTAPAFVSYLNSRRPLPIVGNEVSGTTVVHRIRLSY